MIKRREKNKKRSNKISITDRVRQRAKEKEAESSGLGCVKIPKGMEILKVNKKGIKKINIIPYRVSKKNLDNVEIGEYWYKKTFLCHRGIGADNKGIYVCPKTEGKKCPICESLAEEMSQIEDRESREYKALKAMSAKERNLFNVVDLDDEEEKVKLMEISSFCFDQLLVQEVLEGDPENADFANPEGGFTLKVRFSEDTFGGGKFILASKIDFLEREDLSEEVLSQAADLDAILKVLSYDELRKKFLELDDDDDPKPSKKTKDDDEDSEEESEEEEETKDDESEEEEEDEDEDLPFDDEEESEEEEDSEEEDEEEDEEEEKEQPKRSNKKTEKVKKCPVKNKVFGKDYETLDQCDSCELWEECGDEKERIRKEKKKQRKV